MGSQTDLNQGGTFRQMKRVWMGPSVGWLWVPDTTVLPITATGTTIVARGMNLVTINVNATVTVQLSSSKQSPAGPQAIPGQSIIYPTTVVDVGGFANSTTAKITIL